MPSSRSRKSRRSKIRKAHRRRQAMKALIKRLARVVLLSLFSVPAPAQSQDSYFSIGTGFFVDSKGYVLSSSHVIDKCRKYAVYGADSIMQATLVARDAEHDLVLLKASFPADAIARFNADFALVRVGDPLITI